MPQTGVREGALNEVKKSTNKGVICTFMIVNQAVLEKTLRSHPIIIVHFSNIPTSVVVKNTNH